MNKTVKLFAIAKGSASTEGREIKRYIGVGSVYVKAVNPTKSQLSELFGREQENDPQYLTEIEVNGVKVPAVRLEFIIKTDAEKCNGIDTTQRLAFVLRNQERFNNDGTKLQVIDEYGRTAWVTREQFTSHAIPQYSNGPANITSNYRPCFVGEEALTKFIKAYLNIPNVEKWKDGKVVGLIDTPSDAEVRLDNIAEYFKGNFSELQEILSYQPNNKVKVMFGVKTTDDNKQYQAFYTDMVLKNGVKDYSNLEKDYKDRKNAGAYSTTEFDVCELKEHSNTPSEISATEPVNATPASWFNNR